MTDNPLTITTPSRSTLQVILFKAGFWLAFLQLTPHSFSQGTQDCIVEELVFSIPSEHAAEFVRLDAEIWTKTLSEQPGFLSKVVWTSRKRPDEVRLIVRWKSQQDWNRVPKQLLEETEKQFRKAMRGKEYRLVEVNAIQQRWIAPNVAGSQTMSLTDADQDWLATGKEISVRFDLVYRKAKRYRAVSLQRVLENSFDLNNTDKQSTRLVFECNDGYLKTMPLAKAIAADGWIAVADLDAPADKRWLDIGGRKSPGPYYVVWRSATRGNAAKFPWPYAVERLRIVEQDEFYQAAYPTGTQSAVPGYHAFRKHCLSCHAVNGVGGTLGVELNMPRSVTEYWQPEDLRAFILDPSSYRLRSKMPTMKHLKSKELDSILLFLRTMAQQRTDEQANSVTR